jgi:hypothetical protein
MLEPEILRWVILVHEAAKETGKLCKPMRINFFSVGEYVRCDMANRNFGKMKAQSQ